MLNEKSPKAVQEMIKNLVTSIRNCKKMLDHENKMFDLNGIESLHKNKDIVLETIQDFHKLYSNVLEVKNLKQVVPEQTLQMAATEHDILLESIEEYQVNLLASARITEMFMESMKTSIASSTKKDMGYNKNGKLVSDRTVLEAMPSISFNSKV